MNFGAAIASGFRNCFKFTGRASRSEFWWFYLFFVLAVMACGIVTTVVGGILGNAAHDSNAVANIIVGLLALFFLVLFVPVFSLMCRRLHDSEKSAWLVLLYLVPFGGIVLLVFYCLPGTNGPNSHGADPLGSPVSAASVF